MTAASPDALSLSIVQHAVTAQNISDRLANIAARLVAVDPLVAGHAVDHADEHLGWAASELRTLATTLDAIRAYTTVGAEREERARRARANDPTLVETSRDLSDAELDTLVTAGQISRATADGIAAEQIRNRAMDAALAPVPGDEEHLTADRYYEEH